MAYTGCSSALRRQERKSPEQRCGNYSRQQNIWPGARAARRDEAQGEEQEQTLRTERLRPVPQAPAWQATELDARAVEAAQHPTGVMPRTCKERELGVNRLKITAQHHENLKCDQKKTTICLECLFPVTGL